MFWRASNMYVEVFVIFTRLNRREAYPGDSAGRATCGGVAVENVRGTALQLGFLPTRPAAPLLFPPPFQKLNP